jgi:hypothetical protein
MANKQLTLAEQDSIIALLRQRFEQHVERHSGIDWQRVENKLRNNPRALWSIFEMDKTGGEPDVIGYDTLNDQYIYCDCSKESPAGRRSLCYDRTALNARKTHKPVNSVCDMAEEMGIALLTESDYFMLQSNCTVDTKTSSWLNTPPEVRKLGGALFGDYRFGRTFIYHNGADSYYGARGFRGLIRI